MCIVGKYTFFVWTQCHPYNVKCVFLVVSTIVFLHQSDLLPYKYKYVRRYVWYIKNKLEVKDYA